MSILGAVGSIAGGIMSSRAAKKESNRQYDLARNTIKYRVEDAQNAGVHPLYALGAPTMSSASQTDQMGQAVADAGSQLGKAYTSAYERELQKVNLESAKADLMGKKLRNADFVKQSLEASHMAGIKRALGSNQDGQDIMNFAGVKVKPRNTPASEGEDYFGETGLPYTIWNTLDHLAEDAPKAYDTIKLWMNKFKTEKSAPVRRWWNKFKSRRGW